MSYFAADVGTTNTRVWLLEGEKILARTQRQVGVRDTAVSGNPALLRRSLRATMESLKASTHQSPHFVLAAGMITSAQGLQEVPHVMAPVGKDGLSRSVRVTTFADVCPCPFFFVPGVRIKPSPCQVRTVEQADIIRGEECEIVGLQSRKQLTTPWVFLHLGSHTKAIHVDEHGRIVRSVSTLFGECLDVLRLHTILSHHFRHLMRPSLSRKFFHYGYMHSNRSGLLRGLFMVRLLSENSRYSRSELYSYVLGALVASDCQTLESSQLLGDRRVSILVSGHPLLQRAWSLILEEKRYRFDILHRREREKAFLEGLRKVVFSSPNFRRVVGHQD